MPKVVMYGNVEDKEAKGEEGGGGGGGAVPINIGSGYTNGIDFNDPNVNFLLYKTNPNHPLIGLDLHDLVHDIYNINGTNGTDAANIITAAKSNQKSKNDDNDKADIIDNKKKDLNLKLKAMATLFAADPTPVLEQNEADQIAAKILGNPDLQTNFIFQGQAQGLKAYKQNATFGNATLEDLNQALDDFTHMLQVCYTAIAAYKRIEENTREAAKQNPDLASDLDEFLNEMYNQTIISVLQLFTQLPSKIIMASNFIKLDTQGQKNIIKCLIDKLTIEYKKAQQNTKIDNPDQLITNLIQQDEHIQKAAEVFKDLNFKFLNNERVHCEIENEMQDKNSVLQWQQHNVVHQRLLETSPNKGDKAAYIGVKLQTVSQELTKASMRDLKCDETQAQNTVRNIDSLGQWQADKDAVEIQSALKNSGIYNHLNRGNIDDKLVLFSVHTSNGSEINEDMTFNIDPYKDSAEFNVGFCKHFAIQGSKDEITLFFRVIKQNDGSIICGVSHKPDSPCPTDKNELQDLQKVDTNDFIPLCMYSGGSYTAIFPDNKTQHKEGITQLNTFINSKDDQVLRDIFYMIHICQVNARQSMLQYDINIQNPPIKAINTDTMQQKITTWDESQVPATRVDNNTATFSQTKALT